MQWALRPPVLVLITDFNAWLGYDSVSIDVVFVLLSCDTLAVFELYLWGGAVEGIVLQDQIASGGNPDILVCHITQLVVLDYIKFSKFIFFTFGLKS
jgi:hypothetical protein